MIKKFLLLIVFTPFVFGDGLVGKTILCPTSLKGMTTVQFYGYEFLSENRVELIRLTQKGPRPYRYYVFDDEIIFQRNMTILDHLPDEWIDWFVLNRRTLEFSKVSGRPNTVICQIKSKDEILRILSQERDRLRQLQKDKESKYKL